MKTGGGPAEYEERNAMFHAVVGLLAFIFWLWMLIDAIQNPRLVGNQRIVWVLVIIFLPCLGALLYLVLGRK